jgi:hypothetical protein
MLNGIPLQAVRIDLAVRQYELSQTIQQSFFFNDLNLEPTIQTGW